VVVLPVLVIAAEVVALPVLAIGVEVVALPVPTLAEPVVFDTALEVAGPVAAPGAPAPAIPSEPEQAVSVTKSAHRGQRTPGCDNQFLMSFLARASAEFSGVSRRNWRLRLNSLARVAGP
jgi:hypothetical protein